MGFGMPAIASQMERVRGRGGFNPGTQGGFVPPQAPNRMPQAGGFVPQGRGPGSVWGGRMRRNKSKKQGDGNIRQMPDLSRGALPPIMNAAPPPGFGSGPQMSTPDLMTVNMAAQQGRLAPLPGPQNMAAIPVPPAKTAAEAVQGTGGFGTPSPPPQAVSAAPTPPMAPAPGPAPAPAPEPNMPQRRPMGAGQTAAGRGWGFMTNRG